MVWSVWLVWSVSRSFPPGLEPQKGASRAGLVSKRNEDPLFLLSPKAKAWLHGGGGGDCRVFCVYPFFTSGPFCSMENCICVIKLLLCTRIVGSVFLRWGAWTGHPFCGSFWDLEDPKLEHGFHLPDWQASRSNSGGFGAFGLSQLFGECGQKGGSDFLLVCESGTPRKSSALRNPTRSRCVH